MKISIVIPNYNGANLLEKNIPRLINVLEEHIEKTGNIIEVIIVDDCSNDTSHEVIEKLVANFANNKVRVSTHKTEVNKGFAHAVNLGAKMASGEILILLNSDTYPEDDFITPFLSHFAEKQIFGVGFMDRSVEKGEVILRGRGIGGWRRGFLIHRRGEVDNSSTLWINGGSSAYRKEYWDKLGGMDELYSPFYWEDIDISYRAQKAGYRIYFESKSVVVHEHEKGAIAKTYTQDQVKKIAYRNQILFTWLNATDKSLILTHVMLLPYHLFKFFLRFDWNFYKGLLAAFFLIPKVIQSRNRRKSLSVQSDREVIAMSLR